MMGNLRQNYFSNNANEEYLQNTISLFLSDMYNLLKECYGPYGSHILIANDMRSEATKDGRTILSKIRTNGSISNAVHDSIMSVADKQVEEVGDGSTTTILLLCLLYEEFRKIIKNHNLSPTGFNNHLNKVVNNLIDELKASARKIVDENGNIDFDILYDAVLTTVDGDTDLANIIIKLIKELNNTNPCVVIELSPTSYHNYQLVKGVEITGTAIRPDVFFNGYSRKSFINPKIVCINGRLDISLEKFNMLAEDTLKNDYDMIFIATGIDEITLNGIVGIHNTNPVLYNRVAVFQTIMTSLNDEFLDTCAALGATPIDSESIKKMMNVVDAMNRNAGSCTKADLTEWCIRFNEPKRDEENIKHRLDIINEKIDALKKDPAASNDRLIDLENRKSALSLNYAKLYVGGYSPQRKSINYELVNDAIPQAISCMNHGIVPGCNTAIPNVIEKLLNLNEVTHEFDDIDVAILNSISDAYIKLFVQILMNANGDKQLSIDMIKNTSTSDGLVPIDIRGNDLNVINSADTDRAILENATDMAALLATAKGFISKNTEFDVVNKELDMI